MSDYNEDLETLLRESEALTAQENALYERRGVADGQPLVAVEGDPEVVAMIESRKDFQARWAALQEYYQSVDDPHGISRPRSPEACTWLRKSD